MKHDYPLAFIRDINDKSITSCFGSTWMGYNISFLFLNEILAYIFQMKKRVYLLLKVYYLIQSLIVSLLIKICIEKKAL